MVRSLAERFGIASQLDKYPNELSGGQRQRASAARAIVNSQVFYLLMNRQEHWTQTLLPSY